MATRGVKITGLNYLDDSQMSGNIIIPVVDPTVSLATPEGETFQTNVYELGNFILEEAGNLFPEANVALTVKNNAQPNITSVGTLTTLSVAGNGTFASNVIVAGNITINGISNLGAVGNVKISGGSNGFVLHTYGNGTLYWDVDDTVAAGPNTAVQFNDGGILGGTGNLTFDKTTSTLSATNIDVDTISIGNIQIQGVGNGTSQQVLGIVDQSTQQLGWKTVPVYYITIELRDGSTYLSSPNALLRVYPVQQRDGSFVNLNTTQI